LCSRCDANPERALEPNKFLHDLVISDGDAPNTVVEMKCWLSSKGQTELPGIRHDVQKLAGANSKAAYMIIFAANPQGQMDEQLNWLKSHVPELGSDHKVYSFGTFDAEDRERDFWVAGFHIIQKAAGPRPSLSEAAPPPTPTDARD
jgi:hypothetical protein